MDIYVNINMRIIVNYPRGRMINMWNRNKSTGTGGGVSTGPGGGLSTGPTPYMSNVPHGQYLLKN